MFNWLLKICKFFSNKFFRAKKGGNLEVTLTVNRKTGEAIWQEKYTGVVSDEFLRAISKGHR